MYPPWRQGQNQGPQLLCLGIQDHCRSGLRHLGSDCCAQLMLLQSEIGTGQVLEMA